MGRFLDMADHRPGCRFHSLMRRSPSALVAGLILISGTSVAGCTATTSTSPSLRPTASAPHVANHRVPIPTDDGYLGLAVDGEGTVWFAEANSSRLGRYHAGQPITEMPLTANANPRTLRSAQDGSIWFAEPGIRSLGHVTPDGKITEKPVNAGEFPPNWG